MPMNRRNMLKWLSGALGTASAAVVVLPGGRFLAEALRNRRSGGAVVKRVARLDDLVVGKPKSYPVVDSHRDAWTVHPDQAIGRVWLLREEMTPGDKQGVADEQGIQVTAFTAVCPHLGCAIQLDSGNRRFVCPCHRAAFDLDGQPQPEENGKKSHAPRGMDSLECRLVRDSDEGEWWVEVKYEKFESGLTVKVSKV
jgi:menaquinol-cytochrome c reductase iron-sulfur subunit